MTDDEKLRNAGWSPNSIRLAMADVYSPVDRRGDGSSVPHLATKDPRFGLKRSTNSHVGTPNSISHRTDLRQTPNFRIGRSSLIDLSISTTKKNQDNGCNLVELHGTLSDGEDDLLVLTQTFRRQSIETNNGKRGSRSPIRIAFQTDENRNPSSQNLPVNANGSMLQKKPTKLTFDITSPVDHRNINNARINNLMDGPRAVNFDHAGQTDPITLVINDSRIIDKSAGPSGSQMEKLLRAACLDSALPNGWKLFNHQKEAIKDCLRLGRSIMAFDMGLGKTLISLIWAKAVCSQCPGCITVIIVPCTLTEVWKREAEMIGFISIDLKKRYSKGSATLAHGAQSPRIAISSWSKIPNAAHFCQEYVLIADEAHAMQSITSIRTKSALKLCLHANCIGLILSTGTPMKNGRPSNIFPLLHGIKHPVAQNKIEFEKRYCNAKKTKFCAWDVSGASNLEELKCLIGPYLMRKTKEECLDLPPMTRRTVKIEIPCNIQDEYNQIIHRMKNKMKSNYSRNRGEAGNIPGWNSSCLEMMSQLRMFSSKSKVPGSAVLLRNMLKECSDPIVVFVWYKETSSMLQAALQHLLKSRITDDVEDEDIGKRTDDRDTFHIRCECLTGDIVKHQMRQDMVDRFQLGEIDVLICTYGVGSTGLTLTRSHTVILLDRPWTPGDTAQAEDRVRRIGQLSKEVESIWIEAFDLDVKLDLMLDNKAKNTAKVLSSHYDKMDCKGVAGKAGVPQIRAAKAPLKTLDDYFNSHSDKSCQLLSEDEDDTITACARENEINCYYDNEYPDNDQASVIGAVFKQLMRF